MALATRCPNCNTTFRVAQDQLKLRGGIVRCGSCNQVFDGKASLFELDATPSASGSHAASPVAPEHGSDGDVPVFALDFNAAFGAFGILPNTLAETPAAPHDAVIEVDTASASFDFGPAHALPPAAATESDEHAVVSTEDLDLDLNVDHEDDGAQDSSIGDPDIYADHALAVSQDGSGSDRHGQRDHASDNNNNEGDRYGSALVMDVERAVVRAPVDSPFDDPASATASAESKSEPEPESESDEELAGLAALIDTARSGRIEPTLSDAEPVAATPALPATAAARKIAERAKLRKISLEIDYKPLVHPGDEVAEDPVADAAVPAVEAAPAPAPANDEPDFVIRSRRRAKMARLRRILMAIGSIVLLLLLVTQGVTNFRNTLAANLPQFKPELEAACVVLHCKVELPTQIDLLTVDLGELQTLGGDTFSFVTMLHNQSRLNQGWPDLELVLIDAAEKPLLRRVISPTEYLAAAAPGNPAAVATLISKGFGPHGEQPIKLYFTVNQIKASGYRVAIFYP